ncbi:threonylcarbamoyl-AMP synthase [Carboxydothermus islandicus]|uniref:Threonylcarbamoyl-AMP synthase n=1 Tax=Carboxydothermus islandicus TaxID=661089 RepID=A0A1L8CZ43_9THEO|nr:L-threonylcarbamoyladenylate synthase [Carboxydothermus islandicus]GAV24178.1 threonylcarbamoyl-AMP synthase [Carboxydothermus islandicus]
METKIFKVNPENPEQNIINEAAEYIKNGELVAFPTETVYGLGADAFNPAAVLKIFAAKGRPQDNPLIVHIARHEDIYRVAAGVDLRVQKLMEKFWPGPLTLVLPRREELPGVVSAGLPTVAVRLPDHPVAVMLIEAAQTPIAAPSANRSGRPSPTSPEHVLDDLSGIIPVILAGGNCRVGVESTVLDLTVTPPVILRPGGITPEMLEEVIGEVRYFNAKDVDVPRAPGMKYPHYAPRAPVYLVKTPEEIWKRAQELGAAGKNVGLLISKETKEQYFPNYTPNLLVLGSKTDPSELLRNLYKKLREFDQRDVELILAEVYPEEGLYLALMNRLKKAAAGRYLS